MTTIKVPKALREEVMRTARTEGLTAAQFLKRLVDEHARHQRFAAVREAMARDLAPGLDPGATNGGQDRDYREITKAWDAAAADGLGDA